MKQEILNAKQYELKDDIITKGKHGMSSNEESFIRFLCSKEQAMSVLDELDDDENALDNECEYSLFNFLRDDKIQKINSNVFLVSENDNYNESNIYNDNDSTADL